MIISIVLFILAGLFDATRDKLLFHFDKSVYKGINDQYFDTRTSWLNKYKNKDPFQGEAFPLAKGPLVFLTDAFHLSKYLFNICIILGAFMMPKEWYWPVS